MSTETEAIVTKNFVLEHTDRFLSWDYCYAHVRKVVLGTTETSSFEDIGLRSGRSSRWAYKVFRNARKRITGRDDAPDDDE
jgi:hypothetical protein